MSRVNYSKKRLKGEHLQYEDRQQIERYIKDNHSLPKKMKRSMRRIAHLLEISPATMSRELKRGRVDLLSYDLRPYVSYSADIAQADYEANGTAKGRALKIGHDYAFARYVEDKVIKEKYSPDAIIMELKRDGNPFSTDICTRTLYSYIYRGIFLNLEASNLRRAWKQKKRKYERVRKAHRGDGKGIRHRPEEADSRSQKGHWEMDCIESGKGKGTACLLTILERKTRELIMIKLPSQTTQAVIKALDTLEQEMGIDRFRSKFLSITSDNGSEFQDWRSVERSCLGEGMRTSHYFCHPNSSWERGSNENVNGIIRWFIPKGSAIGIYTTKQIKRIEEWINNLPRRLLNGDSSKIASARAEAA